MVSLAQLWLPIVLSAVLVFFASSVLNMLLKFWHTPDYHGFSNEDEVRATIRKGNPVIGLHTIPYCKPDDMKKPETQAKFREGPIAFVSVRRSGDMNMGAYLGQWFVFCLLVSVFAAYLAGVVLAVGTPCLQVCRVVGTAAFMAHALGCLPNAIWWGHPWRSTMKYAIDGLIYALIVAATFGWLWPR
jgi:hypothetical protein